MAPVVLHSLAPGGIVVSIHPPTASPYARPSLLLDVIYQPARVATGQDGLHVLAAPTAMSDAHAAPFSWRSAYIDQLRSYSSCSINNCLTQPARSTTQQASISCEAPFLRRSSRHRHGARSTGQRLLHDLQIQLLRLQAAVAHETGTVLPCNFTTASSAEEAAECLQALLLASVEQLEATPRLELLALLEALQQAARATFNAHVPHIWLRAFTDAIAPHIPSCDGAEVYALLSGLQLIGASSPPQPWIQAACKQLSVHVQQLSPAQAVDVLACLAAWRSRPSINAVQQIHRMLLPELHTLTAHELATMLHASACLGQPPSAPLLHEALQLLSQPAMLSALSAKDADNLIHVATLLRLSGQLPLPLWEGIAACLADHITELGPYKGGLAMVGLARLSRSSSSMHTPLPLALCTAYVKLMRVRAQDCSASSVCMALQALALVAESARQQSQDWAGLDTALLSRMHIHLPILSPSQLSKCLVAIAALSEHSSNSRASHTASPYMLSKSSKPAWQLQGSALHGVQQALLEGLPSMGPADVSNMLHALAFMRMAMPTPLRLLVLRCTYTTLRAMNAQDLASVLQSLVDLRCKPDPFWMDAYLGVTFQRLPTLDQHTLPILLSSIAKLGYRPNASWMQSFINTTGRCLSAYNGMQLALVLHALGTLRYNPETPWLHACLASVAEQIPRCELHVLSLLAQALARLQFNARERQQHGLQPGPAMQHVQANSWDGHTAAALGADLHLAPLLTCLCEQSSQLMASSSGLAAAAAAAAAGSSVAAAATSAAFRPSLANTGHVAALGLALARLRHDPGTAWHEAHLRACMQQLGSASLQDIAQVWHARSLQPQHPLPPTALVHMAARVVQLASHAGVSNPHGPSNRRRPSLHALSAAGGGLGADVDASHLSSMLKAYARMRASTQQQPAARAGVSEDATPLTDAPARDLQQVERMVTARLLAAVQAMLLNCGPQGIVQLVCALTVLQTPALVAANAKGSIQTTTQTRQLPGLTSSQSHVSSSAQSLGSSRLTSGQAEESDSALGELRGVLLLAAHRQMHKLDARGLARLTWALATLHIHPGAKWLASMEACLEALHAEAREQAEEQQQQLQQQVEEQGEHIAQSGCLPPREKGTGVSSDISNASSSASILGMVLPLHDRAIMLWSLARMARLPHGKPPPPTLLRLLLPPIAQLLGPGNGELSKPGPRDILQLVWAMHVLRASPPAVYCDAVLQACLLVLPLLKGGELGQLLYSLSRFGRGTVPGDARPSAAWMQQVSTLACEQLRHGSMQMPPQGVAGMMLAWARWWPSECKSLAAWRHACGPDGVVVGAGMPNLKAKPAKKAGRSPGPSKSAVPTAVLHGSMLFPSSGSRLPGDAMMLKRARGMHASGGVWQAELIHAALQYSIQHMHAYDASSMCSVLWALSRLLPNCQELQAFLHGGSGTDAALPCVLPPAWTGAFSTRALAFIAQLPDKASRVVMLQALAKLGFRPPGGLQWVQSVEDLCELGPRLPYASYQAQLDQVLQVLRSRCG